MIFPLDNFFRELTNEEIITKNIVKRIRKRYNLFTELLNIASTVYKWNNISDDKVLNNIISTNIERALMLTGFCAFVKEGDRYFPLPFVPATVPSLDFRPYAGICIGYNGQTYEVTELDSPILKNTPFGWSAISLIDDYSDRIETIDTTASGIVNAMQVPFIISTPDNDTRNEVANEISNALIEHRPIVIQNGAVGAAFNVPVSILNTTVNGDALSKLTSYRNECFAEFMRYLGVVDVTGEKRERLLVKEVSLSESSGRMLSNPFTISRDENAEYLSKFFGREITYEKNEDTEKFDSEGKEGINNGSTQSENLA